MSAPNLLLQIIAEAKNKPSCRRVLGQYIEKAREDGGTHEDFAKRLYDNLQKLRTTPATAMIFIMISRETEEQKVKRKRNIKVSKISHNIVNKGHKISNIENNCGNITNSQAFEPHLPEESAMSHHYQFAGSPAISPKKAPQLNDDIRVLD
ncbi:hypothetical protein HDU89_000723 [Geranomyces variabilis]|nr:hypothetical protein HDU89_000723 [Geranomyces variabilis]